MNKETIVLATRLDTLKKSYRESNSDQCVLTQSYYMEQYKEINHALLQLEKIAATDHNLPSLSFINLQQAATLLGLYLMV